MDVWVPVVALSVLILFLALVFLLARAFLRQVVRSRAAQLCALVAAMTVLCLPLLPWLNFSAGLWMVAGLLPLGALIGVVVAATVPLRVSINFPADDFGISRY